MIRNEINIEDIMYDMSPVSSIDSSMENLRRLWESIPKGEVFKKKALPPYCNYEGWKICVKIDDQTYIELTWIGNTYIRMDEYYWYVL